MNKLTKLAIIGSTLISAQPSYATVIRGPGTGTCKEVLSKLPGERGGTYLVAYVAGVLNGLNGYAEAAGELPASGLLRELALVGDVGEVRAVKRMLRPVHTVLACCCSSRLLAMFHELELIRACSCC